MTTGSNPKIWDMLTELGHNIVSPVPSLFTFNIKDSRIKDLMGLSAFAKVKVKGSKLEAAGPLLITHWGMSGPGILRLSAWGARELFDKNYQFVLEVNWLNLIWLTPDSLALGCQTVCGKVWFWHQELKAKPNGQTYPKSN